MGGASIQPRSVSRLDLRLHRHRNPKFGRQQNLGSKEALGCYADDVVIKAIQLDLLSDYIWITPETVLPTGVAQDDNGVRRRSLVVFGCETAPQHRTDSEHVEIVARGLVAPEMDVFAALAQSDRRDPVRNETRERSIAIAEIAIVWIGLRDAVRADRHQFIGPIHRQRTQQETVEGAERRGVRADRERQRQHGYGRESGRFAQPAQSNAQVLPHACYTPAGAARFNIKRTASTRAAVVRRDP